ncbi:MAG: RNA-directed DNA polymerase [Treponema sp.]|nr:RNA-directed DNA polymerase [Treponema sp.]
MKRQSLLFDRVIDYGNIRLAFLKAMRGNRESPQALAFCQNTDANLSALQRRLASLDCQWGDYRSFSILDPKPRIISTAPFAQRIMHHAIINVIGDVLERPLVQHCYACRKGKGTRAAVLYAFGQCKAHPYFLKMDVRKYFDSIHHGLLKAQLRRLIKDSRVLALLDGVIDSYEASPGRGVPIGNLTSQFFANTHLAWMDHFILEKLQAAAYCRYMDDFVIWADSKNFLRECRENVIDYVKENLGLELKPPVMGSAARGLPFLGFLVKDRGIYLMQKSKRRFKARMAEISALEARGGISQEKAGQRAISALAAISLARADGFKRMVNKKASG